LRYEGGNPDSAPDPPTPSYPERQLRCLTGAADPTRDGIASVQVLAHQALVSLELGPLELGQLELPVQFSAIVFPRHVSLATIRSVAAEHRRGAQGGDLRRSPLKLRCNRERVSGVAPVIDRGCDAQRRSS